MMSSFVYLLVLQLSGVALGALAVAVYVLAKHRPPFWWAYLVSKLGFATVVGTLLFAILPAKAIPLTVPAVLYMLGLCAVSIGTAFVSVDIIRRTEMRVHRLRLKESREHGGEE